VDDAGAKKWATSFGAEDPGRHRNGSGSNASPVSDGQGVFAYLKSGTLAAVELDGTIRWQIDLVEKFGKAKMFWSHGTSPQLQNSQGRRPRIRDAASDGACGSGIAAGLGSRAFDAA